MQASWRSRLNLSRMLPFLLPGVILLFLHRLAFTNLILARGDTFLYFYPYWEAAADALRSGRLPLWNPNLFMGAPFLANSQVGFFYPLNWPVWLLFPVPYAVSASILLHLTIAGWGCYLAGRRALQLGPPAALLAALLFALGGYLTAQVEHVNQLQGLAWLPWYLAVLGPPGLDWAGRRHVAGKLLGLATLFTLQLLAGHTQTTFITGAGVLIWIGATGFGSLRTAGRRLVVVALAGLLAVALAGIQLLPTLELAGLSSRQGGLSLNEVLSFSLHPLLLTPALLPGYGRSLFTEYVAFVPLTALLLALLGGWSWRRSPATAGAVALAAGGLVLALGRFNPAYWLLARLPGFDLFRAPARWLALYALGIALLAGLGWQWLNQPAEEGDGEQAPWQRAWGRLRAPGPLMVGLVLLLALMVWGVAAVPLVRFLPVGAEAPVEAPSALTWLGWLLELSAFLLLWGIAQMVPARARPLSLSIAGLMLLVLFLASRSLPYNQPTTPEAYFDLRPPVTRLQAVSGCNLLPRSCSRPLTRFLSLSNIFFDPGDQGEIEAIYEDQLPPEARYDYIVAVKQKEIIAPNLPLAYGLAAVDGFDGGILPLQSYSQLMRLILPGGQVTTDGRLREHLEQIPAARWLDLFNAGYIITDKVGDQWHDGVFFDRQHPVQLAPGETAAVGYLPLFAATELRLLADGQPGPVTATAGDQTWQLTAERVGEGLYRVPLPASATLDGLTLSGCPEGSSPCQIAALSLVDSRDDTFHSLVVGQYRLIHSGDVKIYQNLDVQPRAFLVDDWSWESTTEAALAAMADPAFVPRQGAILLGDGAGQPASTGPTGALGDEAEATIVGYAPERLVVQTASEEPALLIVTDAIYPGWRVTVDGQAADLWPANILFRGVFLPAGEHEVVFVYRPASFITGLWLTGIGALIWLLLAGFLLAKPNPAAKPFDKQAQRKPQ